MSTAHDGESKENNTYEDAPPVPGGRQDQTRKKRTETTTMRCADGNAQGGGSENSHGGAELDCESARKGELGHLGANRANDPGKAAGAPPEIEKL